MPFQEQKGRQEVAIPCSNYRKERKKELKSPKSFAANAHLGYNPLQNVLGWNSQRLFIPKRCKLKIIGTLMAENFVLSSTAQGERVEGLGVQSTKKAPENEILGTVRCSLIKKIIC